MFCKFVIAGMVAVAVHVQAASMNKCVGPDGAVSFTYQACAGGSGGERINVQSATAGMRLGPPPVVTEEASEVPAPSSGTTVTVIGPGAASQCSDASDQEVRTAIVKNQVFPGMTAEQARKAWGAPSKINRSSSGSDQWVYYRGDYDSQYVYVNDQGCVTGWN
jgi:predicted lipoprotein with Yx(FWY)xxD motif